MSKAATGAIGRLAGLFNTSRSSVTNPNTKTSTKTSAAVKTSTKTSAAAKTSTKTSAAAITSTKTSTKPETDVGKLKKLAYKFKKSSESSKFRNYFKQAYRDTVHRLATAKQFSLIDDIIQHQKKFKEITKEGFVIRLIMLYRKAGMYQNAHELFDEMPKLECKRTVNSFNALLSTYLHSKKFEEAGKLLEELPEKIGIDPDLISYNTVIKAFCDMGSLDSALLMVDTLENKGLEPDIITFNTLLDGFFSKGRLADGEEIWGLMERKNVVPDVRTYNSKLRGLVHENKMVEAVEFFEEMKRKGLEPDIHSYIALVKGYCDGGNLEQVMKWFDKLKQSCEPDRIAYLTILSFLRKKNEFEIASEICKEAMKQRKITGAEVVDQLVKESKIEEAILFVESGLSRSDVKKLKFARP